MMEASRSNNQRGSDSDAGNVEDIAVRLEDLPEGHLLRLVCRSESPGILADLDGSDDAEEMGPVDWNAVMERFTSPAGTLEARQWIHGPSSSFVRGRRLLLHVLCRSFGSMFTHLETSQDREHRLRVALKAIDVYPEAVGLPTSEQMYPLHILCGHHDFHDRINGTAEKLFRKVLLGYPEAARFHRNGSTVLHAFSIGHAMVSHESDEYSTLHVLEMLLDLFPEAVRIRDEYDSFPLHHALDGGTFDVIRTLVEAYPRAAQLVEPSKPSCIQSHLRSCMGNLKASDHDVTRLLIEASPWTLAHDDGKVLKRRGSDDDISPAGDALDYLCVIYCEEVRVSWLPIIDILDFLDDDDYVDELEYHQYVHSNVAFLERGYRHGDESRQVDEATEATFDVLVTVLRTMYGRLDQCLPLHAAVSGSLCRPWHLVAMQALLSRFHQEANVVDSRGDLPLHLFLKSCMLERNRAIERGYVNDARTYEMAVGKCFRMLLDANPEAAAKPNGDGRLPLHLALDHRSLAYDTLVSPLLELAPQALLTLDTKTRLYPFANASIGAGASVNVVFQLLRRDPTVLPRLDFSVVNDDSQGTRKRKRDGSEQSEEGEVEGNA